MYEHEAGEDKSREQGLAYGVHLSVFIVPSPYKYDHSNTPQHSWPGQGRCIGEGGSGQNQLASKAVAMRVSGGR